ncbi:MAG: CusA/CzcA family heavy metal efflux RND transporter [Gemmataceae bacterium]
MLERILHFSVMHRYLVVLLTVVVSAFGVRSLLELPIDAVPDITNNQVQINTAYPSLSPVEIEKQVTFPLETALSGIPGLSYTRSLSRNGFSQITAVFEDDVDIYFARNQVNERISGAGESLPPGAEPTMGAISTGLGEIYMWTVEFDRSRPAGGKGGEPGFQHDGSYLTPEGEHLRTDAEKASYLRTVQDWIIRPQLKGIPGVAGIDAIGGYVKQYHVTPDPMKLIAYGLTFGSVLEALERNNLSTGAGYIEHRGESYVVRAAGRIERLDQIGNIPIESPGGIPVYVRDVAAVSLGKELRTGSASENGEEVVVGTAVMLIGANSRTVSAAVDDKMKVVNKSLPPSVVAKTVLNRTKLVDATIETVKKNLLEGAVLVIAVLFLLLGNFRAAFITALAIPVSVLVTAIGMVENKISGNLMSLGAIDFGLIVDGAVIIVENCLRRLADKQHEVGRVLTLDERLHEVQAAAKEMIQPSVFGQGIIITVYLPILSLSGVEGKMFHPMAMTVIFALVAAFVLSLTLVPALVALLINGKVSETENVVIRGRKRLYAPILRSSLRHRWAVVGFAAGVFVLSALLFTRLGQEFVPTLDEKDIAMHAMRIPSTGITQSTEMQFAVEKAVAAFPEVAFVFSKTGTAEMAADPMPPNVSDTFIVLKPRAEWPDPGEAKGSLIARVEEAVETVPGNAYEFTQPIQMRFNELIAGVRSDVAVKVYGDDFPLMQDAANRIAAALRQVSGASDVKVEQTEGLPAMNISVDRDAAARLGLAVGDVQDVISAAIGGKEAGELFQGDRRFDLVVRLPDEIRGSLAAVRELPIPLPHARRPERETDPGAPTTLLTSRLDAIGFVPLKMVSQVQISEGPNQISRENGKRRIVVQANVRGRDLGGFVREAQQKVDAVALPAGSWLEWGGQFENLVAARERLMVVVPLCFSLIFLLLFGSFNSVRYALLVFSALPLALSGGVVALWLRGMPFSISAAVGFIALSGVAVLNGLVMVTFINQLRLAGRPLEEAIVEGSLTRLRPVLMTALVASLGFIPMALAAGTGAEVQRPLATVVIGGLVSCTLLTLVVLPALYQLLASKEAA